MFNKPIFFERNRVGRVYKGGKLFSDFFGDNAEDGFFPEEWISSYVKAINKEMKHDKEGISKIKDSNVFFDELIKKYPYELFGKTGKMRILVKILDSAVRLPAQAHPDKEFSKKYFDSEYGKTESWIVLNTRENARIYFGFKEDVTEQEFLNAIEESKTDKNAMERLMKYKEAKKGDIYLVPAKTVHAIGAGCLILEVQEPTDFTIQPEYWCDEYELSDKEMYIGLDKETAVKCFSFEDTKDGQVAIEEHNFDDGVKIEKIIKPSDTDCFIINRITLDNAKYTINIKDSYGVYIVTNGEGRIYGDNYNKTIKKGDYFFMPYMAMNKFYVEGNAEIVECY